MKRILLILGFVLLISGVVSAQQKSVAVYIVGDCDCKNELEGAIAKALAMSGKFRVADRSDVIENVIAKEFSKQSSGSVDVNQIMKLGGQIGADYLLVIDVSKPDYQSKQTIIAKLINVEENSVIGAAQWYNFLVPRSCPTAGKTIVKKILRNLPSKNESINRKLKIVGPFTFQEAIDYEIPMGYSTFNEGKGGGYSPEEVINRLYDEDVNVPSMGCFILSRRKTKSNNRISEMLLCMSAPRFEAFEEDSDADDYYSYCLRTGYGTSSIRYTLEFDKKGNFRYIDIDGKKRNKNEMPGGDDYYIILIPDD